MFEGVIGKGCLGEIVIDDIWISIDVLLENCMEFILVFVVDILEIYDREGYEDEIDDEYEVDWSNFFVILGFGVFLIDKEKSWLYMLDFIFIIIIVMSLLGVFLGVICVGFLFYCICFYLGLSFCSCIMLENYNFEFYDGFKYKVKMNY